MGGFSIGGLGGGLDVRAIVNQILFAERAPIRSLEDKISRNDQKIQAFNDLNSRLSSLLSKLETLNTSENFAARSAASSDEAVLTATADSSASAGVFQIEVNRLARFDNFASDATFSSSNSVIGTGSFDLTVGSASATITIDSSNNTLSGLKNAINSANLGTTAAIVNDGSGFRLTLTSQESGASNAIAITNNNLTLADGTTPLTFSRTHVITDVSELDALLTVNGLQVTNSANQVEGVVEGVTLNLNSASSTTVNLTVSNDTEAVRTSVTEFVEAFNDAFRFLNSQFVFSEVTQSGGVLAGSTTVRIIQQQLSSLVSRAATGLAPPFNSLASIGIDLQNDGTLKIDDSELDAALEANFAAVRDIFLANGRPSNSSIQFLGLGSATQAGTFQVDITQLPQAATISSPNSIAGTLGVDETLTFAQGSRTSVIALGSGQTINEIVDTINAQLEADGLALRASADATDRLVVTANDLGTPGSFSVVSDTDGSGTGIGTTGLNGTGVNVAGTFTDTSTGTVLAAGGLGDVLTGSAGGAEDLSIQFLGSAIGTFGTVEVSLGIAESLKRTLTDITDSLEGPVNAEIETLEQINRSFDADILAIEQRLLEREQILIQQFSRANQALAQLSSLQQTLDNQFTAL